MPDVTATPRGGAPPSLLPLAGAVPMPGGLGAVEGALVGALVLYGVPALPATAAVLLFRGISLSVPVLLGLITCTRRAGEPRPVTDG